MDKEKFKQNFYGIIGFLSITLLAVLIFLSIKRNVDIANNGLRTKGKIVDEYYIGGKHYVKYIFFVNNRRYSGEEKVSKFKCDNGSVCCIGSVFTVIYEENDPSNCDIDLGKYNKYKSRTKVYPIFKK